MLHFAVFLLRHTASWREVEGYGTIPDDLQRFPNSFNRTTPFLHLFLHHIIAAHFQDTLVSCNSAC